LIWGLIGACRPAFEAPDFVANRRGLFVVFALDRLLHHPAPLARVVHHAAQGGEVGVGRVDVSIDFGQTWQQAKLGMTGNKYDWVRWTHSVRLPSDGYYELWVRATDKKGVAQPIVAANWNPQGYGANPINRIAVLVG